MPKHKLCEKKTCVICFTSEPILCDEMNTTDGKKYIVTQRERDIAKIVKFFYHSCRDDILDKERLFTLPPKSFPWYLADAIYQYYTNNTKGWTYHMHVLSLSFEKDEILGEFFRAAIYYNILDSYKHFLHTNNLTHFLPVDLESVD